MSCCSENEIDAKLVLSDVLSAVERHISPMWPLGDFVAVNPLFGVVNERFLDVRQKIRKVRNADLLMPIEYYREASAKGEFSENDFQVAYGQICEQYQDLAGQIGSANESWKLLLEKRSDDSDERLFRTVAEVAVNSAHLDWQDLVLQEISRVCGSHFDEGQAIWPNPWRDESLYRAWKESVKCSSRMEKLGLRGFHALVEDLPDCPTLAIEQMLNRLAIPSRSWFGFLLCEIYSVNGWASFIQGRVQNTAREADRDSDLNGLLAIRLVYDTAIAESFRIDLSGMILPAGMSANCNEVTLNKFVSQSVFARLIAQQAIENNYRNKLAAQLLSRDSSHAETVMEKRAQMVFCIDVRSEIIRRNIESVDPSIETFGFAGFFGLTMEYFPLGAESGSAQCPVLLKPTFAIREGVASNDQKLRDSVLVQQRLGSVCNKLWKLFQTSAISCFSFVETAGMFYLVKLLQSYFKSWDLREGRRYNYLSEEQRAKLAPEIEAKGEFGLSLEKQIETATSVLRNLGLTKNFGKVVAFVGHGSETVNNPYQASLDCGACGGHSGKSNARVLAQLLNSPKVRLGLVKQGISIPDTTWFVPGLHNTTTDEISFFDLEQGPAWLAEEMEALQKSTKKGAVLSRLERCKRLNTKDEKEVFRRAKDWSETRPEWGLAGNAAFIAAPRRRTIGTLLEGRAFLHSYDHRQDPECKVLELIMTAPMVVASWINMQYYASSVDNQAYGSGDKVIHNVIGLFGIQQGNGGDLKTGLPWQSVHDGERLQHQPLRLSVLIEAPREMIQSIIEKHELVSDLALNGWLALVSIESDQAYVYSSKGAWEMMR